VAHNNIFNIVGAHLEAVEVTVFFAQDWLAKIWMME
jgi:hypothetical protein